MMHPMMQEAAKQAPHMMGEMMKPMMMASTGFVAARALAGNPVLHLLRNPLLLLAAGAAAGYLGYKYRKEILEAVAKATDMGKDFALQQKENLNDLMAEAQESNETAAKSASSTETPPPPAA
ncbi:MAG: hypothetical protein QG616_286 [Pseudomonadota bacterium]|jgi:hypothetical protein|nr:hypothetical protein [Pseudomonadota bacterium]MDQ5880456.1 hypothetical protein [Pseudomonadota bacterium]MDQ5914979.1 hypothetical protein [Pseudomonadota bacterium]MDQ5945884.1 hypothetical protein [Pseudomonadota bacterium]MDQ5959673.1 hypothetical protein [Pseudomonadota bacterium]